MDGFRIPGAWIDEAHLIEVKPPAVEIAWALRPALPPTPLAEAINRQVTRIVNDIARQERTEIDLVVEMMRGDHVQRRGIAVIEGPLEFDARFDRPDRNDYVYTASQPFTARLDSRVPHMNIFRFPSQEAYDAWVERGCPTEGEA